MIAQIASVGRSWNLLVRSLSLLAAVYGTTQRAAESAETTVEKPNVLFIMCDDLNCDLACYGHPLVRTPNLDRLAARGVQFENAFCQYPLCGPSRASLLCGLYPDQTLVRVNPTHVRDHVPNVITLPQLFRENGYTSVRIGKMYHYGVPSQIGTDGYDDAKSWDLTFNPRGRDKDEEDRVFSVRPGEYGGYLSWMAADGVDEEQTDGIAATKAIQFLQKFAASDERFFLAVGFFRPHTPYVSPKERFDWYPLDRITVPTTPDNYLSTLPLAAQESITRKKEHVQLSPELAQRAIQAYYAAISFADAQLGRILDELDRTGLAKRTVIVFTSDHGYHLGEHGHWLKTALFENTTHVPLIIAGPGVEAEGSRTAALAELVDIYPTLADLCGLPSPAFLSGVSLVPALRDTRSMPRTSALSQLQNRNYTLRTADFRYTEWGDQGVDGVELYDRRSDPAEMMNVAGNPGYAQIMAQLAETLHARIADARQPPEGITQIEGKQKKVAE